MSVSEVANNVAIRGSTRAKRPRSAVTSGRALFIDGNPNTAWSRRYHDIVIGHISDQGGREMLSEARMAIIKRAAAMECALEEMEARFSRGDPVDIDVYGRAGGHLRRLFETVGLDRRQRDVSVPTVEQWKVGALARAKAEATDVELELATPCPS
jgi:hypothetical protein